MWRGFCLKGLLSQDFFVSKGFCPTPIYYNDSGKKFPDITLPSKTFAFKTFQLLDISITFCGGLSDFYACKLLIADISTFCVLIGTSHLLFDMFTYLRYFCHLCFDLYSHMRLDQINILLLIILFTVLIANFCHLCLFNFHDFLSLSLN